MSIEQEIVDWLHGRPDWQQEAMVRMLANLVLGDSELDQLAAFCKTTDGLRKTSTRIFPGLGGSVAQSQPLHIVSIGEIHGVENLNPRGPLTFGDGNLVVVYGNNGSGKSGYVRILKKICGKTNTGILRANVFAAAPAKRCCKIGFKINGLATTKEWNVDGTAIAELSAVDMFDMDSGRRYLSRENEASYTPRAVALFDDLVRACQGVRERLQTERDALPCKLPTMPLEYISTRAAKLCGSLKATHTEIELASVLTWSQENQKKLEELEDRLKADDPAKLAATKRTQITQIAGILLKIKGALAALSPEACRKILELMTNARKKRQIATEGATKALTSASLDGIGCDTWRALWEAARRYSEEKAYPSSIFPNTADGAKCVLCQQLLNTDAQQRLAEFENYVKGELEATAKAAETLYQDAVKSLPLIQEDEILRTVCQAAGLTEEEWPQQLSYFWKAVSMAKEQLQNPLQDIVAGVKPDAFPWIEILQQISSEREVQAKQLDADALSFDRPKAMMERTELLAKRWTSQQARGVKAEIQRLKIVAQYDELIKGTDHTAISKKAGDIAEKVITGAYIDRFNKELEILGAKRIRVELVKTKTTRGKALHGIRLRGVTANGVTPIDILSEGEKRIVELSAFLADVTGRPSKAPFVFDDPISSFDQDFEERTIDRLIDLSAERQVIVFTHRLSFLGILCDKSNPAIVCIRLEPWGAGEPGDVPLFGKKPESALKKLRDERLPQAEKTLKDHGSETYYPLAKAICSDFRILVERIVELVLLADVIQRHRRAINTKGKIDNLLKIKPEDCKLIDDFMTKYSCYEHSQSSESPVDVPAPDELKSDIDKLLTWHALFTKRKVEVSA